MQNRDSYMKSVFEISWLSWIKLSNTDASDLSIAFMKTIFKAVLFSKVEFEDLNLPCSKNAIAP